MVVIEVVVDDVVVVDVVLTTSNIESYLSDIGFSIFLRSSFLFPILSLSGIISEEDMLGRLFFQLSKAPSKFSSRKLSIALSIKDTPG